MNSPTIDVPAVRAYEGKVTTFLGRMRASDVLSVYDLKRWSETDLDGYQRQLYEERKEEIARYLQDCPIPVIPAILATIGSDSTFDAIERNSPLGHLRVPVRKGAIFLIDGQHRMAGFQWFLEELAKNDENKHLGVPNEYDEKTIGRFKEILNYEVPVLFVDGEGAARLVASQSEDLLRPTERRDIERALFLILNKTQKGIRPSLKDTLQFMIWRAGIKGIPGLEDVDRVKATELVLRLNSNGSPLSGMINVSGARGMHRPVQLSSFVTSLEPLNGYDGFKKLTDTEKYQFIKNFWLVLKDTYPQAFDDDTWRNYLLLKTVGVYVMNRIARDFLKWANENKVEPTPRNIERFLEPLKGFDWNRETSSLKGFQGLGGVDVAYEQLSAKLGLGSDNKRKPKGTIEAMENA
jgi:DGQHR domain-containing protein